MGRSDENEPAADSLNPLDRAADAVSGGPQERQQAELLQAPITINLEAPNRAVRGNTNQNSQNQDATLEALALSRTAQTPNTNWRSAGANQRKLDAANVRNLVKGRGAGRRGGPER